mgnify:CR=1 FL=1
MRAIKYQVSAPTELSSEGGPGIQSNITMTLALVLYNTRINISQSSSFGCLQMAALTDFRFMLFPKLQGGAEDTQIVTCCLFSFHECDSMNNLLVIAKGYVPCVPNYVGRKGNNGTVHVTTAQLRNDSLGAFVDRCAGESPTSHRVLTLPDDKTEIQHLLENIGRHDPPTKRLLIENTVTSVKNDGVICKYKGRRMCISVTEEIGKQFITFTTDEWRDPGVTGSFDQIKVSSCGIEK